MRSQHQVVVIATVALVVVWAMKSPAQDAPPPESKPHEVAGDIGEEPDDGRVRSQPTAEDVISAFERDRPVNSPARSKQWRDTPGTARSKRDGAGAPLIREGEYVNGIPGRLHRDGTWWTFVFEGDGAAAPKRPLRILPNQQLERIVMETKTSATTPVFLLSGEVTLFESSNYILVRKALRRRTTGNLEK